jgi:hypothetical protein
MTFLIALVAGALGIKGTIAIVVSFADSLIPLLVPYTILQFFYNSSPDDFIFTKLKLIIFKKKKKYEKIVNDEIKEKINQENNENTEKIKDEIKNDETVKLI